MPTVRERLRRIPMRYPQNDVQFKDFVLKLTDIVAETFEDLDGRIAALQLPKVVTSNRASAQNVVPLTASDAGASATITVASHTVQISGTAYTFGAGSITGLAYSTRYFVYTDAPEYQNYTSPTYVATTSQQTATAGEGRYYVGDVTTPAAAGAPTSGGGGAGAGGSGVVWP